jgi:hypothetical protein
MEAFRKVEVEVERRREGWRRQFHERLARRARKAQLEKVEEKAAAYPARATGTRWVRSALIFPVAIACTC